MEVVEQPFLTRREILAVLRPGQSATERPFRTLRERRAASRGLNVPVRGGHGHVLGGLWLYSTLNLDAARAYRLHRQDLAEAFAVRAGELEASEPGAYVRDVIELAAADLVGSSRPVALSRYLDQRRHASGDGLDPDVVAREWVTHVEAWLSYVSDRTLLWDALTRLSEEAQEARSQIAGNGPGAASTFFGVVRRMDRAAAEIQGHDGECLLVPRVDLEREGLAVAGQAVALLVEALPGGGTYLLPRPAAGVGDAPFERGSSPFDDLSTEAFPATQLDPADAAWLGRELAREPTAVPAGPLPVR